MNCAEILQNESTCRCCLSQASKVIDIFTSNEDLAIAEALQGICGVDIFPQDKLPHVICSNCLEVLETCHSFRVKTQQTAQTLQNILEGNITVIKEVEESPFSDGTADETNMEVESIRSGSPILTCPYCSKTFMHRRNLQIHKQRHFMVGKYGCQCCTQRFHTKFDLLRHSSIMHSEEKPYQCDDCTKRFPTKPELNRHQKLLHNPVKNFSCSECGMQFKLQANAKQHIHLVHSKERSHICGVCGKAFAFASKLRVHQNSSKCVRSVRISVPKEEVVEEICSENKV